MSQVSKIKLSKDLESELFKQFWYSLAEINDSQKSTEFFSDLLSQTEQMMLAKRFAAAILITRGKAPTEIHSSIHLSYSAISSVSSWVKNSKPATFKLLSKISNEKGWETFVDKIDEILDKISPKRHSDWEEEYKKKRNRNRERSARKSLR